MHAINQTVTFVINSTQSIWIMSQISLFTDETSFKTGWCGYLWLELVFLFLFSIKGVIFQLLTACCRKVLEGKLLFQQTRVRFLRKRTKHVWTGCEFWELAINIQDLPQYSNHQKQQNKSLPDLGNDLHRSCCKSLPWHWLFTSAWEATER